MDGTANPVVTKQAMLPNPAAQVVVNAVTFPDDGLVTWEHGSIQAS